MDLCFGWRLDFFNVNAPEKRSSSYCAMALALIGITIFEILFEARARYLYLYAPIFVLMTGYTIKGGTSGHEK